MGFPVMIVLCEGRRLVIITIINAFSQFDLEDTAGSFYNTRMTESGKGNRISANVSSYFLRNFSTEMQSSLTRGKSREELL